MLERNQKFMERAREYGVPEHMIDGLELYVFHRVQPGGFMRAVLENDLKEALGRADSINQHALKKIVSFMYNEMPAISQGSVDRVRKWLREVPYED